MSRLGDVLEASWSFLGGVLGHLGGFLEASWKRSEAFWTLLMASWRFLEACRSVVKLKNDIFPMKIQ